MKKNLILYILLLFLIVVNGFFLYNYTNKGKDRKSKGPRGGGNFIVKELGFNETQLNQFEDLSHGHHETVRLLSEDIVDLKDELFDRLSDTSVNKVTTDSIATLIGEKVKEKELETFSHFKKVQAICNDEQKKKFKNIIKDALRRGGERGQRPPKRNRPDRHQPPPRRN